MINIDKLKIKLIKRINKECYARKLTTTWLAKNYGCDVAYMSKLLNFKQNTTLEKLFGICDTLGIEVKVVFDDENNS